MAWGKKRKRYEYGEGYGYQGGGGYGGYSGGGGYKPFQGAFDYSYLTKRNINVDDMVMEADALDALYFSSTYNSATRMGNLLRQHVRNSTKMDDRVGVENKLGDIFTGLFDWDAALKENPPDLEWAARLAALHEMPEYEEIRKQTVGYRSLSAAGSVKVWDLLQKQMQDEGRGDGVGDEAAKQRLREALKELGQGIEDAKELGDDQGGGYSPDGEGAARYLYDPALEHILRAQENYREIVKIAGRMEIIASRLRADKLEAMGPPIDITIGNDLTSLIPSEFLLLADDDTEDYFYMKYLEARLMQYDRADIMQHGRGPIVMCIDISGSMEGTKSHHAAAFALALAKDALKQRRKAYAIPFQSGPHATIEVKPGGSAMQELLSAITRTGGGTGFENTLEQAEGVIKNKNNDADIVFLTDGGSYIEEEWAKRFKARKEEARFKLLGIQFVDSDDEVWPEAMVPLMDAKLTVSQGNVGNLEWYGQIATTSEKR
jgi:uncharacterized protein with von Willebrand factor type A (vWA) domain